MQLSWNFSDCDGKQVDLQMSPIWGFLTKKSQMTRELPYTKKTVNDSLIKPSYVNINKTTQTQESQKQPTELNEM